MSVLVDTNVLLHRIQPNHEHHIPATDGVFRLLHAGEMVCFTSQGIAEFWNVLTRPIPSNGFGLAVSRALDEVRTLERIMTLLPDTPAIYPEWKRLVVKHGVMGVKVHDARLVAAMNVYGVGRLLTFNTGDFKRYGIDVAHPSSV